MVVFAYQTRFYKTETIERETCFLKRTRSVKTNSLVSAIIIDDKCLWTLCHFIDNIRTSQHVTPPHEKITRNFLLLKNILYLCDVPTTGADIYRKTFTDVFLWRFETSQLLNLLSKRMQRWTLTLVCIDLQNCIWCYTHQVKSVSFISKRGLRVAQSYSKGNAKASNRGRE